MPVYNNTKKKQFSKFVEQDSSVTKDKKFKALFRTLWLTWSKENLSSLSEAMDTPIYDTVDLAHLKGKASHPELRYNIGNVQLISREAHSLEHGSGKQVDYRPKSFIKWIKTINCDGDML